MLLVHTSNPSVISTPSAVYCGCVSATDHSSHVHCVLFTHIFSIVESPFEIKRRCVDLQPLNRRIRSDRNPCNVFMWYDFKHVTVRCPAGRRRRLTRIRWGLRCARSRFLAATSTLCTRVRKQFRPPAWGAGGSC